MINIEDLSTKIREEGYKEEMLGSQTLPRYYSFTIVQE